MSNFKMPTAYQPSNVEWVRPIESLTSDGVRELQRLKVENAKLRELVQYICDENYGDDWFAEKAAELGIEARY